MITARYQESGQTMLSDAKLVAQLQAGDVTSFEVLFQRHYGRIFNVLFRLLGSAADAEDVTQQVFLKLYESPQRVRLQGDAANVAGWLYRVAVNTGYNSLRSQKRQQDRHARWHWFWFLSNGGPNPADIAENNDLQARVRNVLAEMKPREAKLLVLRYSGLSYKELAVTLNLASGSIGSLLTRAERTFVKKYRLAYPEQE